MVFLKLISKCLASVYNRTHQNDYGPFIPYQFKDLHLTFYWPQLESMCSRNFIKQHSLKQKKSSQSTKCICFWQPTSVYQDLHISFIGCLNGWEETQNDQLEQELRQEHNHEQGQKQMQMKKQKQEHGLSWVQPITSAKPGAINI